MRWILRLVEADGEGESGCLDVMDIVRPDELGDIADLGLTLAEAKLLQARVQQGVAAAQARGPRRPAAELSFLRRSMPSEGLSGPSDSALFGRVTVRLPRFRCAGCTTVEAGLGWPSNCRSTPELDQLQAHLSALMTYRVAAGMLEQMLPIDAGKCHETLRCHTLKLGEQLHDRAVVTPATAAAAIAISLDSTFIRSCEDGERHLEVRVGNVETEVGGRQVFGAVVRADTDIVALIGRKLEAVGRNGDTELTGFTDGCPGLRSILATAGVANPPILDWFHIAMRLQHLKQTAGGLLTDDPARVEAKAAIVEEVERLRWRLWNGKAKDAQISIGRIRKVIHAFQGEPGSRQSDAPSRKLWTALHELNGYLTGQSNWLVN
jgi:hypothetical protein